MQDAESGEVTHVITVGEDITARVEAIHAVGRAEKLALVRADRIGLAQVAEVAAMNPELDRVECPPDLLAKFGDAGRRLAVILGRVPGDRVLLVGDMALERDWCAAGRLAGYLPAERYFPR